MTIDLEKYLTRIVWVVSLLVATIVVGQMGPNYPIFSLAKYGGLAVIAAFMAYLIGFIGYMIYMVGSNEGLDEVLLEAGVLKSFLDSLTKPAEWANRAIILTAVYGLATLTPYTWLWAAVFVVSVSVVATTIFLVLRNFRLLSMFARTTLRASFLHALFSHENCEGCEKCDCGECSHDDDKADPVDETVN